MKKLKIVTHLNMLITTPSLFPYPPNHIPEVVPQKVNWLGDWWWGTREQALEWTRPTTYDEIMQMLDALESGELERRYPPEQLERVNEYLAILAKEGILPNEFDEEADLKEDSYDLLYGEDSGFQLARYLERSSEYMLIPAVLNGYSGYSIVQCGKISKAWKKTKKYAKKHKKAIIIGAVVVVAVAAVAVAVVVATSASAASAASTAAGAAGAAVSGSGSGSSGSSKSESNEDSSSTSIGFHNQVPANDALTFQSAMEEQVSSFKENIAQENFFRPSGTNSQSLSLEETGRVVGPIFAHNSFNQFNDHLSSYPQFAQDIQSISSETNISLPPEASRYPIDFGHNEIDRRFASDYGSMFSNPDRKINFNALSYQMRGSAARAYGYYDQAVADFSKAIDMNPADPLPYLYRSSSYFDLGQYGRSLEDFQKFTTQIDQLPKDNTLSISQFSLGFAKGLPKGVYESGEGILLFLVDFVTQPINTSTQMVQALSTLANLARNDEWGIIGEALSPEISQLIKEWDSLPSDKRGELAGYAVGKHGGDILAPGALAKVATKSIKSAKELAAVCKNIKIANETLVLEAAGEIGSSIKVSEVVNSGKTAIALGEDVGLTAREMAHLKKAGNLEGAINSRLEKIVSQSESEVLKSAIDRNKHIKMVKDYLNKPAKEIQKGINSYEKQIAIHKDKIANPTKHYPDWNALDPRQRNALINKKWPLEIKGYEEQKDMLQSILKERFSYE